MACTLGLGARAANTPKWRPYHKARLQGSAASQAGDRAAPAEFTARFGGRRPIAPRANEREELATQGPFTPSPPSDNCFEASAHAWADWFATGEEPPRFASVVLPSWLLDQAAQLCALCSLLAYDAVQFSCAVAARAADESCTSSAAFDGALRAVAAAEGFKVVPAGLQ